MGAKQRAIIRQRASSDDPPGWHGNIFRLDGKNYGIQIVPGKDYDWDVTFPVVPDKNEDEPGDEA